MHRTGSIQCLSRPRPCLHGRFCHLSSLQKATRLPLRRPVGRTFPSSRHLQQARQNPWIRRHQGLIVSAKQQAKRRPGAISGPHPSQRPRTDHATSPPTVTGSNTRPPSAEIRTSPRPMSYTHPETVSSSRAIAPATEGCVRKCCNCSRTFSSVNRRISSLGFSSGGASELATLSAASAFLNQRCTVGIFCTACGSNSPFIAPQSVCPHTTTC